MVNGLGAFLGGFRGYEIGWLRRDVFGGLAVAAVGLPTAIAYPAIAGLRPETGIYASIAPAVAYAIFGASRQLMVGPDAATMTVLAAVITAVLAAGGPQIDPATIAAALALGVGAFCLLARALGLGVLANFLSRPILIGFFTGIALSILIGQIGRCTGLSIEADGFIAPLVELTREAGLIHWPSLLLAATMFALLQIISYVRRFVVPGPVVVLVLSVALSALFDFRGLGIKTVGDIPSSLPAFELPAISASQFGVLLPGAAAIFLVSFGAGIITAKSFGVKTGQEVDSDRELTGFGAANIASGLFGAFPVTASDSRTAVNIAVGGRSQIVGIVAAATLICALLFFGSALSILPIPALGAILAATALNLIDLGALRQLWQVSRIEFVFALIALWVPITFGVLVGVLAAVGATFAYLLREQMTPRDALLGRVPGREGFYKLHRTPQAVPVPGLTLYLLQDSLLFFNADYVRTRLLSLADNLTETRWLLIDASSMPRIDSTAAVMLGEVQANLAARDITLGLVEPHAEVREMLERAKVAERLGPAMIFDSLDEAFRAFLAAGGSVKQADPVE
jgi:SulP family sulfate permease